MRILRMLPVPGDDGTRKFVLRSLGASPVFANSAKVTRMGLMPHTSPMELGSYQVVFFFDGFLLELAQA
jgi:hypothetical protein